MNNFDLSELILDAYTFLEQPEEEFNRQLSENQGLVVVTGDPVSLILDYTPPSFNHSINPDAPAHATVKRVFYDKQGLATSIVLMDKQVDSFRHLYNQFIRLVAAEIWHSPDEE